MNTAYKASLIIIFAFLFFSEVCHPQALETPSLKDLGISSSETAARPDLQASLEKRTTMLKTHQFLGLITAATMTATYLMGEEAKSSKGARNTHMIFGLSTAALYFTSASFAILAPRPEGVTDTGSTKLHRLLAWVHGPAMILTPILGLLAKNQVDNGKGRHLSGLAKFHEPVANVLFFSYLASIGVMVINF